MLSSPWQKPFRSMHINKVHPLARGLVGCWVMNEGTGDAVFDLSGNSNDGVLTNNARWVTTENGIGTEFPTDNGSDRINVEAITSNDPLSGVPSGEISIAVNVYVVSGSLNNDYPRIFDKSDGPNCSNGWMVFWDDSLTNQRIGVQANTTELEFWSSDITRPAWYSVVVTLKSGNNRIYINGIEDVHNTDTFTFPSTTTNAAIGNWNHATDRQWNGYINYVYVYDRIISAEEVVYIHREPYAMFQPEISSATLFFDLVPPVDYGKTLMTMLI